MSIIIIGAGLSGLALAHRLHQAKLDVQLLEANSFAGGRIQPAIKHAGDHGHQDLGPTWVWPYAQPSLSNWVQDLDLKLFDQFESGSALLDKSADSIAEKYPLPSQYGSARFEGGTYALIQALLNKLPDCVQYNHIVTHCEQQNNQWQISATTSKNEIKQFNTDQVIVATPPRLATKLFSSNDKQLNQTLTTLSRTETWMAPHAKVVALFDKPFWRNQGLSGRVASQVGPLGEIHDHSGPDGTPAALFGFAGVPALVRASSADEFKAAIKAQLIRCFGSDAEQARIIVKDWAFEPFTTTEADRNGSGAHPHVLDKSVRAAHCNNSLWFAGAEVAAVSAGLIEGALARADEVALNITKNIAN